MFSVMTRAASWGPGSLQKKTVLIQLILAADKTIIRNQVFSVFSPVLILLQYTALINHDSFIMCYGKLRTKRKNCLRHHFFKVNFGINIYVHFH